jgi:hypothetical protein
MKQKLTRAYGWIPDIPDNRDFERPLVSPASRESSSK